MGQTIVVPVARGVADLSFIYTLNEVASFVWQRLSLGNSMTIDELTQAVVSEFEITPEQARSDLQAFLVDLEQAALIRLAGAEQRDDNS
jgi:hypothetical protein